MACCEGLFFLIWVMCFSPLVVKGQAPGDADEACMNVSSRPSVVNQDILMASYDYYQLLESNGGPWAVVDSDGNNDVIAAMVCYHLYSGFLLSSHSYIGNFMVNLLVLCHHAYHEITCNYTTKYCYLARLIHIIAKVIC